MGEKEIIGDTALGGGVIIGGGPGLGGGPSAGGPGTGGGPVTGGGPQTGGGPGGGPRTDGGPGGIPVPGGSPGSQADDCAQLEFKARELEKAIKTAADANRAAANQAVSAFYDSYKPAIQGAKITDAVVSSNNAVGEAIIDAAIKAAGYIEGGEAYAKQAETVKGKVLEGLKQWMKDGATSAELEAAKQGYAAFVAAAATANASAATIKDLESQLDAVVKEAAAKPCPPFPVDPPPSVRTFNVGVFGQGAERGQAGPTMTTDTQSGTFTEDLFAAGSKAGLSF